MTRHIQAFDAERGDDEGLDTEARECYRELAETIKAWVIETAKPSSSFGAKVETSEDRDQIIRSKDEVLVLIFEEPTQPFDHQSVTNPRQYTMSGRGLKVSLSRIL